MDPRAAGLLEHWFGGAREDPARIGARVEVWFRSDPRFDTALRDGFADLHAEAAAGRLEAWRHSPPQALALLLLLDQLPRNLFRGSAAAFGCDVQAQALCLDALARGHDAALTAIEACFLYLPLEHAEDAALQQRSVACFEALAARAPAAARASFESFADYARAHRDVIARFGRFPHRNAALGRTSTPEELAWLAAGGGF